MSETRGPAKGKRKRCEQKQSEQRVERGASSERPARLAGTAELAVQPREYVLMGKRDTKTTKEE